MPLIRHLLFILIVSSHAQASSPTYDVNTVEPGGLYFATDKPGRVVRAPTLKADVEMIVSGPIIRTRVTQHFENTDDAWVEGIYTYPLPKGSAIDVLKMQTGERVIEGEIQEKEQAKQTFERARDEGRRASLIIQRRPNIFSTRIANIGPGETVRITIEYQDLIEPRDNVFELRFPMVVRPRYNPGIALDDRAARAGWGFDTDEVPDGSSITQPLVNGARARHNPVTLKVSLNPGFEMQSLTSPSHEISIVEDTRSAEVRLAEGDVPADQDFILRWKPKDNAAPQIGVFSEDTAQGKHQLLVLLPPTLQTNALDAPARELVIVLDKSGSMGGQAIRQAKSAVRRALMRLKSKDSFNVIAFDNSAQSLFDESKPVTDRTIDAALDFVGNVQAGGGTEMSAALAHALSIPGQSEDNGERLKQVIFVTDGAVGNETALMAQIKDTLGAARLFTVGIGSAPNNYFMSEAAHFGRGAFINIAMQDDVMDAMAGLFAKIERPQITNLSISGVEDHEGLVPATIPDLYDGEPVILAVKSTNGLGGRKIIGERGGQPWSMEIPEAQNGEAPGVASLWARRTIRAVNRSFIDKHSPEMQTERRNAVLALALDYHLVSDFTSLVAVEKEAVRDSADPQYRREVPANLPAGMDWATRKRMTIRQGLMTASLSSAELGVMPRSTATPMARYLLLGLTLMLLSVIMAGFASLQRRQVPE